MSSVDVTKTIKDGEADIELKNVNNELLYTYYDNFTNFKVIPFSQMNSDYLSNYKEIYDRYVKVVKAKDDSLTVMGVN